MSEEGKRAAADIAARLKELTEQRDELLHCLKVIVCHAEGRNLDSSLHLNEARVAISRAERAP